MNKFDLLMKGKQAWNLFQKNHPQFPAFLQDVKQKGVVVGTDVTITVTYPDGQSMKAGLHVKPDDLELLEMLQGLS